MPYNIFDENVKYKSTPMYPCYEWHHRIIPNLPLNILRHQNSDTHKFKYVV